MQYLKKGIDGMLVAICLGTACMAHAQTPTVKVPGIEAPLNWIHAPLDYQLTKTGIAITAPGKTDKYIAAGGDYKPDNATELVFDDASKDFILSTAVSHKFTGEWDSGGLIVEADAAHWFKFEFERDYTGAHRVVSVVTKDFSDDVNAMEINSDTAYFEVAKAGDAFYLYVSADGKTWLLVRTFNFQSKGSLKVGLIAQCPQGKEAAITFSDVRYSPVHIKDIWKGQ